MWRKTAIQLALLVLVFFLIFIAYRVYFKTERKIEIIKKDNKIETLEFEKETDKSNLIKNLKYTSKDNLGNEYTINSEYGELDLKNPDIILMTNVNAKIIMNNSDPIFIKSDFAEYNNLSYATTFNQNVSIKYLENKALGENLNISIKNSFATMKNNIIFENSEIKLLADVIEFDLITKNSKIFMIDENKKIKILNK